MEQNSCVHNTICNLLDDDVHMYTMQTVGECLTVLHMPLKLNGLLNRCETANSFSLESHSSGFTVALNCFLNYNYVLMCKIPVTLCVHICMYTLFIKETHDFVRPENIFRALSV